MPWLLVALENVSRLQHGWDEALQYLVHTFRNRIEHFEDDVIGIWAGLWNLVLSY